MLSYMCPHKKHSYFQVPIYVSHGFILFFWGQFCTSYMLTDCFPSNCKKNNTFEEYILTNLLRCTTTHTLVSANFSNFLW